MSTLGARKAEVPPQSADLSGGNSLFLRLDGANRPLDVFKNGLINGSFDFWQRGTSFSAAGYGPDRFSFNLLGSNGTIAVSQQIFNIGDIASESVYYGRFGISNTTAVSDGFLISQKIEGVRRFAGKRTVIRGMARRSSGSGNVAVEIAQNFGSGGSPSSEVDNYVGQISLSTVWTAFSLIVTLPSLSGKTIGTANDYLGLNLWLSAGSNYNARTNNLGLQTITVDFADLEIKELISGYNDIFPGFERIPKELDLARSLRFYSQVVVGGNIGANNGSGGFNPQYAGGVANLPVQMRATPSVLLYDMAGNSGCVSTGSGNSSTISSGGIYAIDNKSIDFDALLSTNYTFWWRATIKCNAEF